MDDTAFISAHGNLISGRKAFLPVAAAPAGCVRKNGAPFFRANADGLIALRMPSGECWPRIIMRRLLALVLTILLSPLFIAISLLVFLDDGGPVFFSQPRTGFNGGVFNLFKFRTMRRCRAGQGRTFGEPLKKISDDPRITRIGAFLRRYSLDELPQLVNIAVGDMAFVGPRPLPVEESHTDVPWQSMRARVMPGLTGLWQVTLRNRSTFDELCRIDFLYACARSLRLDIAILRATVAEVVNGNGR